MKCYDKLHNQDEEDVDCGGVCEPCDVKRAPARKNRIIIYGVLIALCSIFVVMVYRRGKGEASIFKKEITGRVYKFKSKLKNAKQGVQIREANADPRLNQLQGYINWCLAQGYSYQSIKQSLINSGWPEYYIDQAFGNLNNIRIGG